MSRKCSDFQSYSDQLTSKTDVQPFSEPDDHRSLGDSRIHLDVGLETTRELVIDTDEGRVLNKSVLSSIRSVHDSEVQKHKGNERRRKHDVQPTDSAKAPTRLKPSDCSKLVSVLVRDVEGLEKSIARLHRWDICAKLDINRLAVNTHCQLDMSVHCLYQSGSVSKDNPLEEGKFVVVIKDSVSFFIRTL